MPDNMNFVKKIDLTEIENNESKNGIFEDYGMFYASNEMLGITEVLSVNSGLIYNIKNYSNVKIIRIASKFEMEKAKLDISQNSVGFCGIAGVYLEKNKFNWDY